MGASQASDDAAKQFDVVIVGGSLAGASVATLVLRQRPDLRVLIVERTRRFDRHVGESTVEVSSFFLNHVLGLTQHLNHHHLLKQGMRFWFANADARTLEECSELGNRYQLRLPTYQIDRGTLDEEVLERATQLGAELWRGASATRAELEAGGTQKVTVEHDGQVRQIEGRWLIDASGSSAFLARRHGWWRKNTGHPVSSVWARWQNVKDWDSLELKRKFPDWGDAIFTSRGTATNHLTGDGWWAWVIPLRGGDVSVGAVFDERLVAWPSAGDPGQRLKDFLCRHPVGKELLSDASWIDGDVHQRRNFAYRSERFAGDGFALVGDAAAFLDPLYSPGLDWLAYTTWAASRLVLAERSGEPIERLIERHQQRFARSYDRWFEAVYRDKYEYLGEFDLMRVAFQLDVGLYHFGVASQPHKAGRDALGEPMFSRVESIPFYYFMRFYNRRLANIARRRRQRHSLGRSNRGRRGLLKGFSLERKTLLQLGRAFASWAKIELDEAWQRLRERGSSHAEKDGTTSPAVATTSEPGERGDVVRRDADPRAGQAPHELVEDR